MAPRRLHITRTRQRHAHAAPGKALGLAKQAQVGAGHAQGFFHPVEHDACGLHAAVDDGAGAGVAQAGVHRQAEDGAGVQLEFPAARLDVLPDNVAAIDVRDAWVRAAVPGQSGTGAFLTVQAPQGAKLVAVKSAAAGVVEIHEMKLENDVMKMRAIPAIDLPAGEQIKLAPGGLHLMMMDLKQPITAGQTLSFTLTLEDANGKRRERQIEAQVRSGAGAGQGDGHGAHQHH